MCKNTDENVNPMPTGNGKKGAAAIKALIGIAAVGDIAMSSISLGLRKNDEKEHERGIVICDGIDLILTLVDFGLSCGVGYGIYSPMDSSNKIISGSDYVKNIADTSDAAGLYSDLWICKTIISLWFSSIPTIMSIISTEKSESETVEYFLRLIDILGSVLNIVLCSTSAGLEINACAKAGKVDGDIFTNEQKKDKSCFLCETIGFICDDVCALFDDAISIGDIKNVPVCVVRNSFEGAYAVSMFTEAGLIRNA